MLGRIDVVTHAHDAARGVESPQVQLLVAEAPAGRRGSLDDDLNRDLRVPCEPVLREASG